MCVLMARMFCPFFQNDIFSFLTLIRACSCHFPQFKSFMIYPITWLCCICSASIGTTTTGADLSPIIPSQQWANIIQEKLGLHVAEPKENYPMFLVDSEGMGIRGEAFDFITTSPPAVIAKVCSAYSVLRFRYVGE